MVTKEITDYKTVEVTEKVTYCDECNLDKEEFVELPLCYQTEDGQMNSATSIDMCLDCVVDKYGIDIEDNAEIIDIYIAESGDVTVETKVHKTTIWPVDLLNSIPTLFSNFADNLSRTEFLPAVVVWPLLAIATILNPKGKGDKGHGEGSVGAILWIGLILFIFTKAGIISF